MEARLQAFAARLRDNGVRVSTAELVDAGRALGSVGLESRAQVRAALRATLVKRQGDLPIFERLFDLLLAGVGDALAADAGSLLDALALRGLDPRDRARIAEVIEGVPLSALARGLVEGRPMDLARALDAAAADVDFAALSSFMQQGLFTQRLLGAAGFNRAESALEALEAALAAAGLDPALVAEIQAILRARLEDLRAAARRRVEAELESRHLRGRLEGADLGLEERPLYSLTAAEIAAMEALVARLAERLKVRLDRRRKVRRLGRLDVHRTLRRSLRYGGLPMEPVRRRRPRARPDLVVLVDVSDSVRNVARFFLQFAYTLQDVFDRVRSFVFVADLGEATGLFQDADVHQAVDLAFAGRVVSLHASSDYGRALVQFHRHHLAAVTHKTTVLVLGDGRNNRNPPNDWVLRDIRRRARRLVWLCPEDRLAWGFGDSEMLTYARHCDHAEPVRRLSELDRAMARALD